MTFRRITATLTAGAIVLATALRAGAAFAPAASAAASPRTPVVYQQGWSTGSARPGDISIGEGGYPGVAYLHWSHWTGSSARATGKLIMLRNPRCTPTATCPYVRRPVVVRLARIRHHNSRPYFTRMSWSYSTHGRHHTAHGRMGLPRL